MIFWPQSCKLHNVYEAHGQSSAFLSGLQSGLHHLVLWVLWWLSLRCLLPGKGLLWGISCSYGGSLHSTKTTMTTRVQWLFELQTGDNSILWPLGFRYYKSLNLPFFLLRPEDRGWRRKRSQTSSSQIVAAHAWPKAELGSGWPAHIPARS